MDPKTKEVEFRPKWKSVRPGVTNKLTAHQKIYSEELVVLNSIEKSNKRMLWNDELEERFTNVISQLGIDASPKQILHHMNVTGITGRQVGSHLQKIRKSRNLDEPTPVEPSKGLLDASADDASKHLNDTIESDGKDCILEIPIISGGDTNLNTTTTDYLYSSVCGSRASQDQDPTTLVPVVSSNYPRIN